MGAKKEAVTRSKSIGRPKLNIDEVLVERLAERFCAYTEIAAIVGCNEGTIRKRFSEVVSKGREKGKRILREWQLKAAENGNPTMLIWLGKMYLDQRDEVSFKHGGEIRVRSLDEMVRDIFGISYSKSAPVPGEVAPKPLEAKNWN